MVTRRQGGFTLIEIMIALAISASLASIVIVSQGAIRNNAQFRNALDNTASYLDDVRTAATTSTTKSGDGTNLNQQVFGELITVNPGSSTITVSELRGVSGGGQTLIETDGAIRSIVASNPRTFTVPYQTIITSIQPGPGTPITNSGDYHIVFHRLASTGQLAVYDVGNTLDYTDPAIYTEAPFAPINAGMAPDDVIRLNVVGPGNYNGTIIIDGPALGAITTEVQE